MALELRSDAFQNDGEIPRRYTEDGDDASPPLRWSGAPDNTRAYAIIVDDPDAPRGTWVHWVAWDIPAVQTQLPENVPASGDFLNGVAKQGTNDFGRVGYGGPAPPPGAAHRYSFRIYALDDQLRIDAGARKSDVEAAMRGHVLAEGALVGCYGRGRSR